VSIDLGLLRGRGPRMRCGTSWRWTASWG